MADITQNLYIQLGAVGLIIALLGFICWVVFREWMKSLRKQEALIKNRDELFTGMYREQVATLARIGILLEKFVAQSEAMIVTNKNSNEIHEIAVDTIKTANQTMERAAQQMDLLLRDIRHSSRPH